MASRAPDPAARSEPGGRVSGRAAAIEILLLGAAVVGALAVPHAVERSLGTSCDWAHWFLPSVVLLVAAGTWIRRVRPDLVFVKGGRRPWIAALTTSALAVLLVTTASAWPQDRLTGPTPSLLHAAALVALIPIAEELFFRGALLAHFRGRLGPWAATLVVSLLFGFLHSLQGQFWVMLIASMILCQATLLTNSLLWATLLHAGWNTLTAVVTMPSGTQRVALAVAVAVVMLSLTGWGLRSRQRAEN